MSTISCGIDFGTSNSSIATSTDHSTTLIAIENQSYTIPSAVFFTRKDNSTFYGREAMQRFLAKNPGRLMRSLKRVLGTSIMKQGTMVNGEHMKFEQIIAGYLQKLKCKADESAGSDIENVVMGRPVHFVDNDPNSDSRAETELKLIAKLLGFKNIEFQFEPIAAAFAHEVNVSGEKLALVADLGGGTSDFSIIRLSKQFTRKADRSGDILANTGVRIGGNDFDKDLSLAAIMPELGYKSTYGEKNLEVPLKYYHDLSEWSKVNFLYTPKIITQTKQLLYQSHDKTRFGRLLQILEQESGHAVLAVTEDTKIALTDQEAYFAPLSFLEGDIGIQVTRKQFDDSVKLLIEKIRRAAMECVSQAAVDCTDIDLVILTGGTTEIPLVQNTFRNLFPKAEVADENKLSSVGLGLAFDGKYKFS